ncbi:MAG: proton-conducting transporter membrane subunit, partial [Staphylococcus warneri]|nr:proton-conducting transporter membrane subunit [Staphylococcus warneri]
TGSTTVSEILASPVWTQRPGVTAAVAVLIAASAFTKSAQFPFHFWLPEAMAAATPVSAFLHAAAVVKAGVYLLIRFSTIFHDVAVWNWLLIVVGMGTAVMSAVFAVQKTDLKKLTAYSTVSHLGWIVATIGVGTPFAIAAALVHTLAHALFKSSLFMLIGVIDHEAGSRDIRRLGPLWNKMPWTFGSVVIGAASMAAVPPLLGFVSKEGMLTAFEDAPIGGTGQVILLIVAAIGAFFDGPRDMGHVHEAPVSLWLPAALPGFMSLPLVFVLGIFNNPIDHAVAAVGLEHHSHLALWHGLNVPFLISLVVLIAGIAGIFARKTMWASFEDREFMPRSGNELLHSLQLGCSRLGRVLAKMSDSHNPSRHMLPIVILVIVLAATTLIREGVDGVALQPRVDGLDNPWDLLPLGIIALAMFGLVRTQNRLTGAIMIGIAGTGVTL